MKAESSLYLTHQYSQSSEESSLFNPISIEKLREMHSLAKIPTGLLDQISEKNSEISSTAVDQYKKIASLVKG
jgi:hypothetical protein